LARAGCARLAGRGIGALPDTARALSDLLRDGAACKDMVRAGPVLVDGNGVERIATAMHAGTTPS